MLEAGDGGALAELLATAPSVSVYRHLWRALAQREYEFALPDAALELTVFALPLLVVAGKEDAESAVTMLPGVLGDVSELTAILREHRALGGNETFALSGALTGADAIDVARLPELLAWRRLGANTAAHDLPAAPISVPAAHESVHLRFLVGTAIAAPGVDPLRDAHVGGWGIPIARSLVRQLGAPGVTLLALPRAPQRLMPAVWTGRAAQREVSAQLFASNAVRRYRSSVGEPVAVISAHRASVPGGGELRLSLSSPFDPRDAEGFRCPLHPLDSVADVAAMLLDLLRQCRVTDVRTLAGVHPERDAATGLPLFYKPETIPPTATVTVH